MTDGADTRQAILTRRSMNEKSMKRAYEQYAHSLALSYLHYGKPYAETTSTVPAFAQISGLDPLGIVKACIGGVRSRLRALSPALSDLVIEPQVLEMETGDGKILIPMFNQQGLEWYGASSIENYDFIIERQLGLLDGAETIYDLGGHHGVWAAYYSKSAPDVRTVYSFEPSILNVEVSALLQLINDLSNVVTQAAAVGTNLVKGDGNKAGMLVDFIEGQFNVSDFMDVAWQRADFMKIDIEGYEYELATYYPWIFSMSRNLHLELHIPHLEMRGLDYKRVIEKIPFDRFEVYNYQYGKTVEIDTATELSSFCSLMLKEKV